jgi:nitrogenase subunit NifH
MILPFSARQATDQAREAVEIISLIAKAMARSGARTTVRSSGPHEAVGCCGRRVAYRVACVDMLVSPFTT